MKRPNTFAATLALACGLAAFTGTAVAGNGNGSNGAGNQPAAEQPSSSAPGNSAGAPGQQQKAQQSQPATQSAPKSSSPGQVKKASTPSHTSQSSHSSHSSGVNSTTAGMKPSSTTSKRTHTTVGASPDVSKRYGNGKTAAQIAKSRGAGSSVDLYGPGNSQPHKVATCKHPQHGGGGGVDVHAVKSFDSAACTQAPKQTQQQTQQTQQTSCPSTTITATEVVGVWHHTGSKTNPFVLIHPSANSAHLDRKSTRLNSSHRTIS